MYPLTYPGAIRSLPQKGCEKRFCLSLSPQSTERECVFDLAEKNAKSKSLQPFGKRLFPKVFFAFEGRSFLAGRVSLDRAKIVFSP